MKKEINTKSFFSVGKTAAHKVLDGKGIEHVYGECSSVCDLANHDTGSSFSSLVGIIDLEDLGLQGDNITMQDVIKKSIEKGYSKIIFSDIINYINSLENLQFGSQTAIMSLMDEVFDGDFIPGRIYLQPSEDGYLYKVGFLKVDELKALSKKSRFLVKKHQNY